MANDISRERNNILRSNEMISRERNNILHSNEMISRERNNIFRSNEMISRERNNIRFFHRCPLRGSVQYTVTFKKKKGKSYLTIEKWKRTCMHYKCVTKCNKDL